MMIGLAIALFVSCQKEQSSVTNPENNAVSSLQEGRVTGVTGAGPYAGSIQSSYAAALADNYVKKFNGQTQSVAFKTKDLIAFLTNLQNKYKSDVIYVNFGVYGKGAAPVSSKDYGKLTVFFTGSKAATTGNKRVDEASTQDPNDPNSSNDQYLNHGGIWP